MSTTVTAMLKLVLRELPPVTEQDGLVHMALTNEPRGLPKDVSLATTPLHLACPVKQWNTACTKVVQMQAAGAIPLVLVEAHVSAEPPGLVSVVKSLQVVEGKKPATSAKE